MAMIRTNRGILRTAFAIVFGALLVVVALVPMQAHAVTAAEKQAEAQAAQAKLDEWQQQLDAASDNYYAAMSEHDAAVSAMNDAQARIDAAQSRIDYLQDHLSTRARGMYRSGSTTFIDVLLDSSSFEELVNTWDILNKLNEDDQAAVSEMKQVRQEAQDAYNEYQQQEQVAQQKLDEAEQIKAQAESTVAQYQAEVAQLDAEAQQLVEQEQQAAAARAAAEAASSGSYASSSPIPANGSVVDYAYSRLGCPYVWGATGPNAFDCSGLTQWCYAQAGISIPRTSSEQRAQAPAVLSVSAAQPGDILWRSGHVGICIEAGGGKYIAAPHTGDVVKIQTYPQWTCALRY
jgi:cell wall-associated NlpC family hydrolase